MKLIGLGLCCLAVDVVGLWVGPWVLAAASLALLAVVAVGMARLVKGVQETPNWIQGHDPDPEREPIVEPGVVSGVVLPEKRLPRA